MCESAQNRIPNNVGKSMGLFDSNQAWGGRLKKVIFYHINVLFHQKRGFVLYLN